MKSEYHLLNSEKSDTELRRQYIFTNDLQKDPVLQVTFLFKKQPHHIERGWFKDKPSKQQVYTVSLRIDHVTSLYNDQFFKYKLKNHALFMLGDCVAQDVITFYIDAHHENRGHWLYADKHTTNIWIQLPKKYERDQHREQRFSSFGVNCFKDELACSIFAKYVIKALLQWATDEKNFTKPQTKQVTPMTGSISSNVTDVVSVTPTTVISVNVQSTAQTNEITYHTRRIKLQDTDILLDATFSWRSDNNELAMQVHQQTPLFHLTEMTSQAMSFSVITHQGKLSEVRIISATQPDLHYSSAMKQLIVALHGFNKSSDHQISTINTERLSLTPVQLLDLIQTVLVEWAKHVVQTAKPEFDLKTTMNRDGGKCKTRNGLSARIIATDRKAIGSGNPILALVLEEPDHEAIRTYTSEGAYSIKRGSLLDLMTL